jgi:hypothetical protein
MLATVGSLRTWLKIMLTPISTLHYVDEYFDRQQIDHQKVYMPGILVAVLGLVRLLGFPLRLIRGRPYEKRRFQESDDHHERARDAQGGVTATENRPKARLND